MHNKVYFNLINCDVQLIVDPIKFEIVFVDLISNAIQSMGNKGRIEIRVEEKNDHILIEFVRLSTALALCLCILYFKPSN